MIDLATLEQLRRMRFKDRRREAWTTMVRDAEVYVKGAISHPDHETIHLAYWHRVVPNRETEARAMRSVAFLD